MKSLVLCCLAGLLLSASVPAAAAIWLGEYPAGTLLAQPQPTLEAPLPASVDLTGELLVADVPRAPLPAPLPPVPEPMLVVMLACGLLLIMPGTWLAEWSRLGDRRRLLRDEG